MAISLVNRVISQSPREGRPAGAITPRGEISRPPQLVRVRAGPRTSLLPVVDALADAVRGGIARGVEPHPVHSFTPQDTAPAPSMPDPAPTAGHPVAERCPPTRQATELASDAIGGQRTTAPRPRSVVATTWVDCSDPVADHPPVNALADADPRSPLHPTTGNEAGKEENGIEGFRNRPGMSDPERDYLARLIRPLGNYMGESTEFRPIRQPTSSDGSLRLFKPAAAHPTRRFSTPPNGATSAKESSRSTCSPTDWAKFSKTLDSRSRDETAFAASEAVRRRTEREAEVDERQEAQHAEAERISAAEFAICRLDHPEFAEVEALAIEEQLALLGPSGAFLDRENGFPQAVILAEKALATHRARRRGAAPRRSPQRR